jgi:hypothetical protein
MVTVTKTKENEMKKYQGKSPNQILKSSEVCETQAGTLEIMYGDMIVNSLRDDDQIHLRDSCGLVASVDLTPRAKELFDKLGYQRDSKFR